MNGQNWSYLYKIDFMLIKDLVFVYQMKDEQEMAWHCRLHSHPCEFEVHYFVQGAGRFRNGPQTFTLSPGSTYVTKPDVQHAVQAFNTQQPVTYYAILFALEPSDAQLTTFLEQETQISQEYRLGTNFRFFFEELREKALSGQENLRYSASHQFQSLLFQLGQKNLGFPYGDERNAHIEKSLRILQSNIFRNLTLTDLAKEVGLNESYLIRLFRHKMKTTPMKYLTKLRIEAVSSMLTSTALPLYRIAESLHFYNEFHLSRTFRQYTGLSPSQYRQKYTQESRTRS